MINLNNKFGVWTAIPVLIIRTIDENENIRKLAFGNLQTGRANQIFTSQTKPVKTNKILKTNL